MKPISFTRKGDVTTYHYSFKDLRWFVENGNRTGDVGGILFERTHAPYKATTFASYGTLENPFRKRQKITMVHFPEFDGGWATDEDIIKPWEPPVDTHLSFKIIDFSDS